MQIEVAHDAMVVRLLADDGEDEVTRAIETAVQLERAGQRVLLEDLRPASCRGCGRRR